MKEAAITDKILRAATLVHRHLGPGLLESAYEHCLCFELLDSGLNFERQKPLPINYKGVLLDCGYRMDIIVEGKVLIEIKSVDKLHPIHIAQLMTYLKLSKIEVGLLLNFNSTTLKDGIVRRVM